VSSVVYFGAYLIIELWFANVFSDSVDCLFISLIIFIAIDKFFFFIFFIFKLYIIVLVLPNIKMNPPQVYMCSPS